MPSYWNAHSDLDWYGRGEPLPTRPQFPKSYDWHLGPAWTDPAALEARAEIVATERGAAVRAMLAANDRDDWNTYDRAAEEFALADRELALLERRIEELT